jgi:hypothetical protein
MSGRHGLWRRQGLTRGGDCFRFDALSGAVDDPITTLCQNPFQTIPEFIQAGVMHVFLESVHADVLADQFDALDAAVELDLAQPADVDTTSAAPFKQLLDLHALHESLPKDDRPIIYRSQFPVGIIEVGEIRLAFFNKALEDPIGIDLVRSERLAIAASMAAMISGFAINWAA